jgi:predicted RNA binding protein YcfA (HicA-like mRNA interferase family)
MKLSPIHRRDFIKRLRRLGWEGRYEGTKHQSMRRVTATGAIKIPIPNPHGSGEISVPKLREMLREMGISPDEWVKLK